MDAASGKASEIAAKRVNRKQLLSSLSKKQGALENSRLGKLLPNDFAEPDTREEDEAVIANAQPLTSGKFPERTARRTDVCHTKDGMRSLVTERTGEEGS